jgi:hypothetical protein
MSSRSWQRLVAAAAAALAIFTGVVAQPAGLGGATAVALPAAHRAAGARRSLDVVHPASAPPPVGPGYWLAGHDGGVFTFGSAGFFGSSGGRGSVPATAGLAVTPDGSGYWLVSSSGAVAAFGSARNFGGEKGKKSRAPIVGIASTPHGTGYWLAGRDGGVFAFGTAHFFGSEGRSRLAAPVVGIAATADGGGYWLVTSKGGVFCFGDARYLGSKAQSRLAAPVVGIAAAPDGGGYWLVTSNGTVYRFGDARLFGSKVQAHLKSPVVAIAPTPDGRGYWLAAANGAVAPFGDAAYKGSMTGRRLRGRVVGMVANPLQASSGVLSILTTKLAPASVSSPYTQTLSASGGLPPYSWKVAGGQLAPGLVLDGLHGLIEGTATGPAVNLLTVQVEDRRGAIATKQLTLISGLAPAALPRGEGALAISIGWLPPGVAASVVVKGPGGFWRSVTATTELVVKPGTYSVSASKVDDGTDTFYPGVTGSPVQVEAGKVGVSGVNYLTEVADTTKVVSPHDLSNLRSISGQSLAFSPPPSSLAGVQAGDVVVAGPSANAPGGFLRRVTSVSLADGTLVLGTAGAGLAQAVPRGSFSVDWPSNAATQQQVRSMLSRSGAPPAPQVSGPGVSTAWPWGHPRPPVRESAGKRPEDGGVGGACSSSFPCQITVKPPGNSPACGYASGTNPTSNPADPISVNVSPHFSITPHFDASWNFPTHLQADAYIEVDESVSASATVQSNVVCQFTYKPWGPETFGIPDINFSIGPVPVNISVLMEIDVTLKAQSTSLITVPTETQGFTLQEGVSYDSQASPNFQPINNFTPENSFSSPTGSGYLKASVGPTVTFAFYCYSICWQTHGAMPIVGPTVGIDGYVRADLQSVDPTWDVGVGFEASIGFSASFLGFTLAFKLTIPIFTAYLASEPPQVTSATQLPTVETGSLTKPYKAYMSAVGFTKLASYWGPPPSSPPPVPLQWSLGNCQTPVGVDSYNGLVPNSSPREYLQVSTADLTKVKSPTGLTTYITYGAVTLPGSLPASDAGLTISFDAQVTDSIGQCTTETFTIPVIAGPHAENYPLANPEIGVPYTNYLQLAMLGLGDNPTQGGMPPYTCPQPPPSKYGRNLSVDPFYPELADGLGLAVSQADLTYDSLGNPVGPNCTIRGTVPASVDPSYVAAGANLPLYVTDSLGGSAFDTLKLGPVAEPIQFCDYDATTRQCPEWPLQSQGAVKAEVGAPFSSPLKAAYGVPLDQGTGTSAAYSYSLGDACGQNGYSTPPGISLTADGFVTGTPTQAGSFTFPVQATDDAGGCAWTWAYLNVLNPLGATQATLPPAEVGVPYQSPPQTATGGAAPYDWEVTSVSDSQGNTVPLPTGLSVDSATGEITGTPGAGANGTGQAAPQPGSAGSYQVTFTLTDGLGATATETLPLNIAPPIAISTPVQLAPATKGVAYSTTLQTSGGSGGNKWSIVKGSLPDGLALSPSGVISGTPAPDAATAIFSVQVTDNAGGSAVAALVLPVGVAITTTSLQEGEVGVKYSDTLQAAGGKPAYTWGLAPGSGPLPNGLGLSAAGVISGTPVASSGGAYPLTVEATDASGGSWTSPFTLNVAAPPVIEADLLPADLNAGYSQALTAVGGIGPFTWSIVPGQGTLPPGISIDGDGTATGTAGLLHGAPTSLGNYSFEVQVKDHDGVGATAPAEISVVAGPVVTTAYLPHAHVGVPYSTSLVVAGGVSTEAMPYHWQLAVGSTTPTCSFSYCAPGNVPSASSLPDGITLSTDGTISGVPVAATSGAGDSVSFTVTDYWGATATVTLTFSVDQSLGLSALSLPEGEVGLPYWAQIQAEGGYAPYNWRTFGTPPSGLAVSQGGTVSGTPTQAGYDTGFMLCATDSTGTPGCTSAGIKIAPALAVVTSSLPSQPAGVNLTDRLQASGGVLGTVGYQWSLPAYATADGYPLPPWLSLTGGGELVGEPPADLAGQSFPVPVQVSDAAGAVATATLTLTIGSPPPANSPTPGTTVPGTTSTTTALPALSVQTVSLTPTAVQAGGSTTVTWTVENTGGGPASGGWQDSVYLGSTPGATTTLLGLFAEPSSSPVNANGTYNDTEPVTIPVGTTAGSYYLTVVPDSNGELNVLSTANGSTTSPITVTAPSSQPTLRAVASSGDSPYDLAVGDGGTVLQTVGGGSSWQAEPSGTINTLYGVAFYGYGSDAIAVGAHGTIIYTNNDGSSWLVEASGTTNDLYAVSCSGTSTCWAVGADGTILATTDGTNWSPETSGTSQTLYAVSCASTSDCWAVGAGGTVVATTDGGTSWSTQTSNTTATLYGIYCTYSLDCWAVGSGGAIVTENASPTWSIETSGITQNLYAVGSPGTCSGTCVAAVGAGGTMLVNNGGSSWAPMSSGTTEDLYGFCQNVYFGGYIAVGANETEVVSP